MKKFIASKTQRLILTSEDVSAVGLTTGSIVNRIHRIASILSIH
jgi:hypothetical protein